VPRHAYGRVSGGVRHQSAHGAAVRSGRKGGRRPRRIARHIALRVAADRQEPAIRAILAAMDGPTTLSLTSAAFANALLVAALALLGKIAYDAWVRFDQRRGVAGALTGEIGAYVAIILEMDLDATLLAWVNIPAEKREGVFKSDGPLADRTARL